MKDLFASFDLSVSIIDPDPVAILAQAKLAKDLTGKGRESMPRSRTGGITAGCIPRAVNEGSANQGHVRGPNWLRRAIPGSQIEPSNSLGRSPKAVGKLDLGT